MHSKYSKEQHLKMNLMAWEEGHRYLAAKRREDPNWGDEFRDGGGTFTHTEIELLGDVSDLDVLQLSCAGDASQAFSLANLGANVTACDFSSVAIEEAKENAIKVGLDVRFVVDDSQRLTNFKEAQFDLVHADYNLYYYEDLLTACHNWHRVLRAGGRLLLHEMLPLTSLCLEEEKPNGSLRVTRNYGDKTPAYSLFHIGDFVSERFEEVEFFHTLSDILNAMIQAGFIMEKMVERVQENAEESAIGKLPYDFFVVARKAE
jgi:ubiquinone/menaquinone biosynthesis C-methylase UbiE